MIGENSGTGTGYLTGKFWGQFPNFPKTGDGDGEDIFGEYWGQFGDRDKIHEFPKFPQNSPKPVL